MYLKHLEIHGFKSFAKKTVLDFEPGITSVVGPNGSGKSNIADGLRWVFGEQSLKLLRGKKSEDVIFAGSDQKARLGSAEINIHFDNQDRIIPIDYSEVVITRRMGRDGTSEYLINGNPVRLLDIQEMLGKSGFGNTSYHVIGQGMIDQLILGGPAAIKELVEEAAGIKPYYLKRDKTIRKLETCRINLGQARALVREIEPRLRSLRRQAKKLEQRSEIEGELLEAQILYFGQNKKGFLRQNKEINVQIEKFDKEISSLEGEIVTYTGQIEEEENRRKDDKYSEIQNQLEGLRKTKQEFLEEQATLRGKIKAAKLSGPAQTQINWQEIKNKLREAFDLLLRKEFGKLEDLLGEMLKKMETGDMARDSQGEEEKSLKEFDQKISNISEKISQAEKALTEYANQEDEKKKQLFVKERLLRNKQDGLMKIREQKNSLLVEQAKLTTRIETLEEEARQALGENFEKLLAESQSPIPQDLSEKIAKLKKQLEFIGGVDELTLAEYKETEERYLYLTSQSDDLENAARDLETVVKELDEAIKKEFDNAHSKISEKFSEYFRILFGGGKATMSIQKSLMGEDEEEEGVYKSEIVGIEIRATPPGKKLAGIAALSGGERALTAIALLCALLASYPSPFVVLDEVDAALDEANSIRFGKILSTLSHKTQFITITHNRETMRQSHTLYGVTMGEDGISRVLSLKLEQAAAYSNKN